jgi:hypothetical protein
MTLLWVFQHALKVATANLNHTRELPTPCELLSIIPDSQIHLKTGVGGIVR